MYAAETLAKINLTSTDGKMIFSEFPLGVDLKENNTLGCLITLWKLIIDLLKQSVNDIFMICFFQIQGRQSKKAKNFINGSSATNVKV